jgi:hypothetical protein
MMIEIGPELAKVVQAVFFSLPVLAFIYFTLR